MKVKLENVRIAFPELFRPKQVNGEGAPAYSVTFLLAPDHPGVKAIKEAMAFVAKEKWGDQAVEVYQRLKADGKIALRDGNSRDQYAGFKGNMYVSARSKTRPLVIGPDRAPLTAEDGKPYGGCYVNAVIDVWAQSNSYGKRVNAGLAGVQFVRDGEPFTGGAPADVEDFAPLEGATTGGATASSVFD
jgi:hypothetical protein